MKLPLDEKQLPLAATSVVCMALYAVTAIRYPYFFAGQVFADLFAGNAPLGIAAVGMTFVILAGGIDLSVASVMALATLIVAALTEKSHLHPVVGIAAAVLAGAAIGWANGALIHFFDLPPFLVTLAMLFLARGICFLISMEPIALTHPFFQSLSSAGIRLGAINLRIGLFVFLAVVVLAAEIARSTPFGRNVYALGGNENAARLMGLAVGRTKIGVYVLSGLCAAAAGVISMSTISSGDPTKYLGLELDAIAAAVIGGTLLSGGVGYIWGTLLGVLILGIIQDYIQFDGTLDESWTQITIGLLVFAFVALQNILSRLKMTRRLTA
jgi:simple sugar transport system permease protein